MANTTAIEISVERVLRPYPKPAWGELFVNDRLIWRFESGEQADIAADNLRKALSGKQDPHI